MQPYTYLTVNIACIIIPLIFSFYSQHPFYKEWKYFFAANIIVAVLFIIWDYFFTKNGIWGFNSDYLTGYYLANLPIEEILFFVCIPYACVFSYFAFKYLIKNTPLKRSQHIISYVLIISLLVFGVLNFNKIYTSITFISTSLFLIYLTVKNVDLSYHYLSYIFILPFFFLSNGILTGSFLVDPIVWYNDLENLGIRIVNIPIEDSIYGLLLIFMNIELYQFFKKKNHSN